MQGILLKGPECRRTRRYDLEVPFQIRPLDRFGTPSRNATSINISAMGLFYITDAPLPAGTPVELFLTMPTGIDGVIPRDWYCTGRVVRVQSQDLSPQHMGVAVQFHYFETTEVKGAVAS